MSASLGAVLLRNDWRGAQQNFGLYFFVCSHSKLDKTYDSICVNYIKLTSLLFGLALPIMRDCGKRSDVRSNKGVGR
jgi:hypothetical protein